MKRKLASTTARTPLSSLGDLLRERGVAVGREPPPASVADPPRAAVDTRTELSRCAKIVLRRERKGHGGKTVTVVDGLGLSTAELEAVAREMRTALGCGSRIDRGRVIVQGDHMRAVDAWLRTRGARQVVMGN